MRLFRALLLGSLAASTLPAILLAALILHGGAAMHRALALSFLLAFAMALALSAWSARRIAGPVTACVRGALEIARGRFGQEVRVEVRHEVGELAYAFNHMSRELAAYDGENRRLIAQLEAGYLATLRSLASAIDAKDPSTAGHSQRVSELSVAIGEELGLDETALEDLARAGLLHDIGKIGIAENILNKSAALAQHERERMRAHPVIGAEILRGVEFLEPVIPAVRHHHERWEGGGYPDGLSGESIPLVARIVNAADTFDAATSVRPYQASLSLDDAVALVQRLRGTQIDPAVCDALLRAVKRRPPAALAGAPAAAPALHQEVS